MVIRQKGESQNGGNKKTKHANFFEKWTFLTPWYAQVFCGASKGFMKAFIKPYEVSQRSAKKLIFSLSGIGKGRVNMHFRHNCVGITNKYQRLLHGHFCGNLASFSVQLLGGTSVIGCLKNIRMNFHIDEILINIVTACLLRSTMD